MKAVIALTASLAVANAALLPRQLENIPSCALNCALSSLGSTGCSTSDFACICTATSFIESLVPCVQKDCTADEYQATLVAASALCQSAGVSLSVPAGASSTAATSAASSSASSASTTEAPTTTAASSESSAATTSAASSAESSSEAMTSAASTTAAATTAGGNGTVSTTSPPSPTGSSGAASRNTIALGGLGAIVALVAAFL